MNTPIEFYKHKHEILPSCRLALSETTNFLTEKKFAADIFKFDENGRKFLRRVKNTVENEKLLVTPFDTTSTCTEEKKVQFITANTCN